MEIRKIGGGGKEIRTGLDFWRGTSTVESEKLVQGEETPKNKADRWLRAD